MKEHHFLTAFHARGGSMPYGDAVNLAMSLGIDPRDITPFIENQMNKGHISGDASAYGTLRLTQTGRIFLMEVQERELESTRQKLEQLQQLADQRAEEKRSKLDDRKFQVKLAFLASALSFLAGLLLQYFTGIVELCVGIFN